MFSGWLLISIGFSLGSTAAPTVLVDKFDSRVVCESVKKQIEDAVTFNKPRLVCVQA